MKNLLFIVTFALAACSPKVEQLDLAKGDPGTDGKNAVCSVSQEEAGALLSCNDGSSVLILNGQNGSIGPAGANGQDGTSCSVAQVDGGAEITCGDSQAFVSNGTNGSTGQTGSTGSAGQDGTSCSVSSVSSGAEITCGSSSALVLNGTNGTNGTNGSNATFTSYSAGSCTAISGTSDYVKISSNNFDIYSNSSCSGAKLEEISQGETYYLASKVLAIWSSGALLVISFN